MAYLYRNRNLLLFAITLTLSGSAAAQAPPYVAAKITPPAKKAAGVQITQGPALELFRNNEAIIRWTSNNPGGTDEHFGLVRYGTDPSHLNLTAKSHIRLNRVHALTVFRVRVEGLKPATTYYYMVDSIGANEESDGVKSPISRLVTPGTT